MVIFINGDHIELRHALMYETFDRVLGGEPRDWSTEFRDLYTKISEATEQQIEAQLASLDSDAAAEFAMDEYVGNYRHDLFGDVEVVKEDDVLMARLLPLLKFELRPAGGHQFLAYRLRRGYEDSANEDLKYQRPMLTWFEVGGDNRPNGFKLPALGIEFKRVAEEE